MAATQFTLIAPPSLQRLDVFLAESLANHSRAQIQRLIEAGHVLVDGQPPTKTGLKLQGGEHIIVNVPPPAPSRLQAETLPLNIIYEDHNLLVIDKPAGMVVHPAPGHSSGTLVNAVLGHVPDIEGVGGEKRPGLVHRLDKDTSGLIVVAKNEITHRFLQTQFKDRTVRKVYHALLYRSLPTPTGRIEAPIGRDANHRQRMAVTTLDKGREAVTEYHVLHQFTHHTYVSAEPKTGRTHQIRVHFAYMNCPIVGDTLYAGPLARQSLPGLPRGLTRQFLHAAELTLKLPDNQTRTFRSPLPADLHSLLVALQ